MNTVNNAVVGGGPTFEKVGAGFLEMQINDLLACDWCCASPPGEPVLGDDKERQESAINKKPRIYGAFERL